MAKMISEGFGKSWPLHPFPKNPSPFLEQDWGVAIPDPEQDTRCNLFRTTCLHSEHPQVANVLIRRATFTPSVVLEKTRALKLWLSDIQANQVAPQNQDMSYFCFQDISYTRLLMLYPFFSPGLRCQFKEYHLSPLEIIVSTTLRCEILVHRIVPIHQQPGL